MPSECLPISIRDRVLRLFCQRLAAWDNGVEVRQDFWRKTIGRYTKQPIRKKDILFDFPRVSPGDQPLTKKPKDSGIEIECLPLS